MKPNVRFCNAFLILAATTTAAENAVNVLEGSTTSSVVAEGSLSTSTAGTININAQESVNSLSTSSTAPSQTQIRHSTSGATHSAATTTSYAQTESQAVSTILTSSTTLSGSASSPTFVSAWNGGSDSSGSQGNTDDGASGTSSGSFKMSQGALIAVIVVVVIVALVGIGSLVLYIVAKRRQWNVRASIVRASRRLTGRGVHDERAARRTAVHFASNGAQPPVKAGKVPHPSGHKRGLVVNVDDAEKGMAMGAPKGGKKPWQDPLYGKAPVNTRKGKGGFMGRLWGNDWK